MIADLLREGIAAFVSGHETSRRRLAIGLEPQRYLAALVLAAATSFTGYLVPEFNGLSQATDLALGMESTTSALDVSVAIGFVVALAAMLLIEWKPGPLIVSGLASGLGAPAGLDQARVWIYLGTLAIAVVNIAVLVADVVFGIVAVFEPVVAGWSSVVIALCALVAVVAVFGSLAQAVFGYAGRARSIGLATAWLLLLLVVGLGVGMPVAALFTGS